MVPDRKKRPQIDPPPGAKKPGLMVTVGVGKPKGPTDDAMPKPPMDDAALKPPDDAPMGGGGDKGGDEEKKCSPERAIVIRADEHCRDCKNYEPTTGECHEVEGQYSPDDACYAYFESMNEPDADDMGGAPDQDTDDMPIMA